MAAIRAASGLLFIALAACSVGEISPGGTAIDAPAPPVDSPPGTPPPIDAPPPVDPSASFDMLIKPLVLSLGCLGCHPSRHQPDLTSYANLAPIYLTHPGSKSLLVKQGPHEGNPFFNDAQKKTVTDWLDSLPVP